jgi:outer membrane protein assembly factor BamB
VKRLREGLLAGLCALGCVGSNANAPFARNAFTAGDQPPRLSLYTVDWWKNLVPPQTWEYSPREAAKPAISPDGNQIVVLTRDGTVHAFDFNGKELWYFHTGPRFEAGATMTSDTVYVPGGDGVLYALKARTGELLWKYSAGESLATTPVLADGKIYVASAANVLYAVEAASGKWLWQYKRDLPDGFTIQGYSTPLVKGGVVYAGFGDGHLVALDASSGGVKWDKALSSATQFLDVDGGPAFDPDGRLIAASYSDGLYAIDPDTGDITWHTAQAGIAHLLVRGPVAFATGEQGITAYSTSTGQALWSIPLKERAGLEPLWAKGLLLVPDREELLFVNPASGRVELKFDPGKGVSAPVSGQGERVYVLSNLGYLYALDLGGRAG